MEDIMEILLVAYALLIVQGVAGYALWLACGAYEE